MSDKYKPELVLNFAKSSGIKHKLLKLKEVAQMKGRLEVLTCKYTTDLKIPILTSILIYPY